MAKSRFDRRVAFRDNKDILELVDRLAAARGSNRTTIYREAIRLMLAKVGLLKDPVLLGEAR